MGKERYLISVLVAGILLALPAVGAGADGGFVFHGSAESLVQLRQEVLIAFHGSEEAPYELSSATYVIRSFYSGLPQEFGWIIPLPATPSTPDIIALSDNSTGTETDLFEYLANETTPTFSGFTGGGFARRMRLRDSGVIG